MRLTDSAIKALQALGTSGEEYLARQGVVDSLKAEGDTGLWIGRDAFESNMEIAMRARENHEKFMLNEFQEELRVKQTVPITIHVGGEEKIIGEAILEVGTTDDTTVLRGLLHADVATTMKLRSMNLGSLSIDVRPAVPKET